jgi:hypothetical protein
MTMEMLLHSLPRLAGWLLSCGALALALAAWPLRAADSVMITEFLANNSSASGYHDEDGAYSDWIELYNASAATVNLDGWFLTDKASDLTKWRFPATNLPPKQFLVVWASGKNRAVPGLPLHTNFKLDADGDYLALVKPDGVSVATEFAPLYPPQFPNISYGISQDLRVTTLVSNTSPVLFYIPSNSTLGLTWTATNFNDAAWRAGTNGVGYQTYVPGFAVKNIRANVSVCDLATADAVLGDSSKQAAVFTENRAAVNYVNTGDDAHFANGATFPGFTIGVDQDNFVTEATGILTVPTNGNWTFGVNSDDGFRVTIGNNSFSYPSPRGPADTFATFALAAGDYPVRLVFYECGGGSEVEFFAAAGSFGGWDASFRLVGDAAGGLSVKSLPTGSGADAGLRPLIATDVEAQMLNRSASAYVRLPFVLASPAALTNLTLRMKYDDGFVAYLNGSEIARRNSPASPQWNSAATASRPLSNAVVFEDIDLTSRLNLLQAGANVLAIQGLNDSSGGTDFLVLANLVENRVLGTTNHYFAIPTPGAPNSSETLAAVADLKFTPGRGWFANTNFLVNITCTTPGATIRYTADGSAPSPTYGQFYTGPLVMAGTTVLRAIGYRDGFEPTKVETHSYLFLDQIQAQSTNLNYVGGSAGDYTLLPGITQTPPYRDTFQSDLLSIPTLSIAVAWEDFFGPNGIWSNPGNGGVAWERPCSAEYMRPDGQNGFHINCGLRIQGGVSRTIAKRSLRLLFKTAYGPGKLQYNLYPDSPVQEFDTVTLHAGFNDHWLWGGTAATMHRDQWCRDTQTALGGCGPHGTFAHLYINGLYWGLHNIGEQGDASFAAHYLGGDKTEYDALNADQVVDGDGTAWNNLMAIVAAGITNDVAYTNLAQYLDIPDYIDYLLMNFYAANTDWPGHNWKAARRRVAGAGLHFISWDAEWTLGIGNDVNTDRTGLGAGDGSPTRPYAALRAHPEFRRLFGDRAQRALFNGGALTPAACDARYAKRSQEIDRAIVGESARWGGGNTRDTWLAAESALRAWFPQRTAILLNQLRNAGLYPQLNAPALSQFGGLVPPAYALGFTNLNPSGAVYLTLDGSDPRLWGGALAPTARLYSAPLTLTNALFVRARVRDGTNWSALVEAPFYVVQDYSKLVLTELMYHPPNFGTTNGDELEFIELKNAGTNTLDLTGLQFTDGITFAFTNGTRLAPGQFFVLVRNSAAFAAKYPGVTINGVYTGKLDNGGEHLTLAHLLGTNVFSLSYGTSLPWPMTPDGDGFSLVRTSLTADPAQAASWRFSANLGGSPGADDPTVIIPPIVINEILTHTDPPQTDAIELFNPTTSSANLGGWFLTDDPAQPKKFRIPDGTVISAGGFVAFAETNFNPTPGVPPSFALSSWGDSVYLFSGDALTNLTGYCHGLDFGPAANGVSFGRYVISTGEEQWPAQSVLTLGATNSGPRAGPLVINEIMYHPAPGYDEFVEIYNLSAAAVPLFDPAYPTNTWKLNGIGYTFPTNLTLPATNYLLLVPIAPAAFRAQYSIAPGVQILGPYSGALDNAGEHLRLERPDTPDTNGVAYIVVDEVRYDQKAPWPTGADGNGPSLQRSAPTAYGNEPTNWFASGITPGDTNVFNQAPACTLLSPTNGATFSISDSIALSAAASDPDGVVIKVEFYDGDIKVGEALTPPYTCYWYSAPTGPHTIVAKARDNGLAVTPSAPVSITVTPPPVGNGTGLKADIYDNIDFTGTLVTRIDPTVNFDWGGGSPDPAIGAESFSIRWTGMVQPRFSELYTFITSTDDGVRLWVNDQLLIDHWVDQGTTDWSGSIQLAAGQWYPIRMEYYENGGGAAARLSWSSPTVTREIIPQAQLYPNVATTIVQQPASQTAGLGSTVTLNVLANNPTGYQWFFNDNPISGATGPSYTLNNVQFSNAGPYRVVVSNTSGSVTSAVALLTVVLLPSITHQPEDQIVDLGQSATFTVAVNGTPPFQFQWRFNGVDLPGQTSPSLVLNNVQVTHVGSYSLRVSNAGGSVLSANAFLGVNAPCTILNQPQSITLGPVSTNYTTITTNFSVTAIGMGPLRYQWRFWGTNLPGATNSTLTLSNVALSDAGPYAVQVWDSVQTVVSSNALLTLQVRPYILVPISAQSVVSGGTASFSVWAGPVHPTLPLTYRWLKGGVYVATNDQPTMVFTNITASTSCQVVVVNPVGNSFKPQVALTVLPDGDGDGMPDTWMTYYFGHTNGLAADKSRPQDDADADGMTNVQEWQAGTDPTNKLSVLKISLPATNGVANGQARLFFTAISNKTYSVQYQDALPGAGWSNLVNLDSLPTNRVIWVTNVPPPGLRDRFYRVKTPRNF